MQKHLDIFMKLVDIIRRDDLERGSICVLEYVEELKMPYNLTQEDIELIYSNLLDKYMQDEDGVEFSHIDELMEFQGQDNKIVHKISKGIGVPYIFRSAYRRLKLRSDKKEVIENALKETNRGFTHPLPNSVIEHLVSAAFDLLTDDRKESNNA